VKLRMTALVALVGMFALLLPVGVAQAQVTVPIAGECVLPSGEAGTATGTIEIERFVARQGQLFAVVSGTVTCVGDTTGTTVTRTFQNVRVPVTTNATCEILTLDLGPLHLDLLGLVVDLDPVHLEITAEQGPGNLLGNLLCALAGLLDQTPSPLAAIAQLLNRILAILG
jgi:hypothetical protein